MANREGEQFGPSQANHEDSSLIPDHFKFDILTYDSTPIPAEAKMNEMETQKIEKQSETKEADKIPLSLKIFFSLPGFCKMSCLIILNVHGLIYYESRGASLLLISFFTALSRCSEIILKPLIAHWSDNSKFALGRRKPFMLFGCGFYAVCLVMLFAPPDGKMSSVGTAIWFGSFYVLFFIADTVCNIPFQALGPELSTDTREREKLYIVFYFFQYIGVLFISVAPVIIQKFFNTCDCSSCDNVLNKKDCIERCQSLCGVQHNEGSLLYMCMFVGLFFVFSIIIFCHVIKEKKEFMNKGRNYLVPTLFRMINNEPFMKLLVPWILDVTMTQIFATMMPFYISFIINPHMHCVRNGLDLSSQYCNANNWIGITIFFFFIFCILSMGLWHYIVQYIGKKKAWQACSLIGIATMSCFLILDEGMMIVLVILSAINSFPAGGGYLIDVFVSDTIDYDEFTTGKRNEGIYVVFSSFTPKIVGLFAQSIPLTIMSLIGFVPSVDGQSFDQPATVKEFIKFYFIGIPVLISLISFWFKMKFPIDTEAKMLKLKTAIQNQNSKAEKLSQDLDFYKIKDPIYGHDHIQVSCKTESQKSSKLVADHFYNLDYLKMIQKRDYSQVKSKLICIITSLIVICVFFFVLLILTFKYLEVKSLSLIPLFSLIVVTITLMFIIINWIRLVVINKVIRNEYLIDQKYITLYICQMKNSEKKTE